MMSEESAVARIEESVSPLEVEAVPVRAARGRFASGDIFAQIPLPPFDNSSMDGYAVRAEDCVPGARLRVKGTQPAGREGGLAARPGDAIRIFTGAPIPQGADAVVMQEDVDAVAAEPGAGDGGVIVVRASVEPGENIRRRGGDLCEGQTILHAGSPVTPQAAALLASQGMPHLSVHRAPRVAILATGDELAAPGETRLSPARIYESNGVMLEMLAADLGAEVSLLGTARDEPEALREKLLAGLLSDALLVSGGVSVGERDLVKEGLRELGVTLDLWRVAVKPGKPFLFGRKEACRIFGLPGNPVSSFVTFLLFVRPALLKMLGAGASERTLPRGAATASEELRNASDRPHYLRGTAADGRFTVSGRQESHALYGLSRSNGLVRLAPGEIVRAGATVQVLRWR